MTATGSGLLVVPSAASCAALNFTKAGVSAVPFTVACGSITHRLPAESKVTPWGAPRVPLLLVRCGAMLTTPPVNCAGMYSNTFVPLAIQRPLVTVVSFISCLHAASSTPAHSVSMTARASPNRHKVLPEKRIAISPGEVCCMTWRFHRAAHILGNSHDREFLPGAIKLFLGVYFSRQLTKRERLVALLSLVSGVMSILLKGSVSARERIRSERLVPERRPPSAQT